jgi:MFS transporter, DHA1 family, multidrug resistance protein
VTRIQNFLFIVLIAGISSLNPVAIDAFLPAMPAIAHSMAIDPGALGVTLGIFTFGTAIGQIIFGPVSDRFGRKPVIVFGLSLYIVTALLAAYATNIETLSIIRFVQGIAAASGRILGVAIARDLYEREKAAKFLSNIWTISTAMPIVNPFIGSALISYFHWSSIFIYMAVFAGLMIVLMVFFFKETLVEKNPNALDASHILTNFGQIASNRTFMVYALCAAASSSALYAFLSAASDILITQLKQDPATFAWEFSVVMLGSMTGSFISGRLSSRLKINQVISIGVTITAIFGTTLLLLSLNGVFTVAAIVIPFALHRIGESIILAQSMAGAITPFPDRAGAASSLLGFIRQAE